jgi:RNA polymerase sigma factor (sigma-70 family)
MCGQLVAFQPTNRSDSASTLTELYEEHATAAFRYALHLTGRREDAEDAVQHVFLQAYRALESGTTLVSPRAWLMKAVKHRSLNVIRDRRERPMEELVAELPAAAAALEDAHELAAVRSMLWTLPEAQHSAFVLRHWTGLSQQEIADVLETTESAVESLLIRARAALVDDAAAPQSDCRAVRDRLVQFLPLNHEHESHTGRCRRCHTARSRLTRTAEIAAALSLGPRLHVAHALAAAIPGFGGGGAAAAAGGSATAASASAGSGSAAMASSGTLVSSAPLAAKAGLAVKALAVVLAATAAASTVHTIRRPLENIVLGSSPAHTAHHSRPRIHTAADLRSGVPGHSSAAARQAARPTPPGQAKGALAGAPPGQSKNDGGGTPPGHVKSGNGTPPGQARKTGSSTPPGQAKKNGAGAAPGQAKKTGSTTPPGQAKKTGSTTPPGHAKKTGSTTPPGHAKKTGSATPPGQAKKTGAGAPPGQAKGAPHGQGSGGSNGNGAPSGHGKGLAKGSSAGDTGSASG